MAREGKHFGFTWKSPSSCCERHDRVRVWLHMQTLRIKVYTNNLKYDPCSGKVGVVAYLWPVWPVAAVLGNFMWRITLMKQSKFPVERSQFMWVEGAGFVGFLINSWFHCADVGKPLRFLSLSWMLLCKALQAELQTSSALSLAGSLPFLWLNV